MNLANFFKPQKIAIIGASNNPSKIGRQILDNIIASHFRGKIFPINIKEKKIAGFKAYASLDDLKKQSLSKCLIIVAIPAPFVALEIERGAKLGAKNFIIISAGFKEAGSEGQKREEEIRAIAEKYKLNILGPNCLGFINNVNNFNASFSETTNTSGRLALVSQSGAIGSAVLDWLKEYNLGLAYFISLGNKAVLNENDFLQYLEKDKNVDAVVFYLEDILQGQEFVRTASQVAQKKPIIILLSGLSQAGEKLAFSHTGALAKESKVVEAALKRAGVIQIKHLNDLFNIILLLKNKAFYQTLSSKVSLITNAGGLAVLTADAIEKAGLELADNQDLLGDAQAQDYYQALSLKLKKKIKQNILVLLTPQTNTQPLQVAQAIVKVAASHSQSTIMATFVGGKTVSTAKRFLLENDIPVFSYPEQAINSLALVVKNQQARKGLQTFSKPIKKKKINYISKDYVALLKALKKYNFSVVPTWYYSSSNKINKFPIALKVVGPDFIHKTDKGGIILNIKNQNDLKKAVQKLKKDHSKYLKNKENKIVLQNQKMGDLELILGIKRDKNFGHVLLFGLGGVYAEALEETQLVLADLNRKSALKALKASHFFPIINGLRGKEFNIYALADALVNLCNLVAAHPEIKELDINPLLLTEKEAIVLDARVLTD
ncbi:MAG: acetate--CoA ligase family protein [Patescibacteria group bacterium]|nr:acetate--CoA ligase family protein [Patescibacteria group bacterium]MDD3939376.1 acetate--CoA ligase family protein [Patescibacteria group bacterium]MDD4443916.1 acetate--CoA ligase family protein [Patescibacteria group bacterium]